MMHIDNMRPWTDDEIVQLSALCNEGLSSSGIGKKIGRTRNSVISKCYRLGFKLRHPSGGSAIRDYNLNTRQVDHAAVERKMIAAKIKAERAAAIMMESISRRVNDESAASIEISDQTPCNPRHWITRKFGECAFPASGSGYETKSCCNATEDGAEYCRHHKLVMTVETQVMTHRSIRFYADRYTVKNQANYPS